MIGIPLDLLKRFRSAFELANSRVNWNSNELLPVGIIVRDIDYILQIHSKDEDKSDNQSSS